ncbi:MAG: hypothetical protein OSB05_07190 [Akkermansiaceae bacterium]|nr:hypothetical protein [Akkermansiaceae bacterium]
MKKSLVLSLVLAIPVLGDHHAKATKGKVALPAGLPTKSDPAGFKGAGFSAFCNRKDFSGWKKVGGTASDEVKDGEIRAGFTDSDEKNTIHEGLHGLPGSWRAIGRYSLEKRLP